jgi:hypothetical protein
MRGSQPQKSKRFQCEAQPYRVCASFFVELHELSTRRHEDSDSIEELPRIPTLPLQTAATVQSDGTIPHVPHEVPPNQLRSSAKESTLEDKCRLTCDNIESVTRAFRSATKTIRQRLWAEQRTLLKKTFSRCP